MAQFSIDKEEVGVKGNTWIIVAAVLVVTAIYWALAVFGVIPFLESLTGNRAGVVPTILTMVSASLVFGTPRLEVNND